MSIVVRPAAAADIDEAYLWYERRQTGLGEEFLVALDAIKQRIAANPEAFPVVHRDTRRALLSRFPYALYYRIYGDVILIVACMRGRRDPRRWRMR
jgi:plasmid stabilization system protein ParE